MVLDQHSFERPSCIRQPLLGFEITIIDRHWHITKVDDGDLCTRGAGTFGSNCDNLSVE
jgi:hypothetical protein